MWGRSRTRRRRRSGTRRRRRRRGRWRRSGRSGGRRCPGLRRQTTSVSARYNVHRGTSAGFTPTVGEPDRAADRDQLRRHDRPRHLLLQGHRRGRGRQHRRRLERGGRDRDRRHDRADAPGRAGRARVTGAPSTSAGPPPPTTSPSAATTSTAARSAGFTPSAGNRIAQPTGTSYADTRARTGSYFYKLTAEDAAGNISAASNEATATIADATPPSAPGTLAATAAGSTINLSWAAATDNVAVTRYNLHRGTTSGFTPSRRQPDRATDRAQLRRHRPRPRQLLLQAHRRRRRRQHRPRLATPPPPPSPTPPRPAPPPLAATGGAGQASLTWTAATDNVAVSRYNLHRSTSSGFTPTTANRIAQPTGTSHTDTGLSRRHLPLQAHRRRRRRQHQPRLNRSHRHRHRPTRHRPRRRLRLRHRHRHHHHRPIRHRQQRHPHQRHLDRTSRQIRQRPHLQRHQRHSSPSPTPTASTSPPA